MPISETRKLKVSKPPNEILEIVKIELLNRENEKMRNIACFYEQLVAAVKQSQVFK